MWQENKAMPNSRASHATQNSRTWAIILFFLKPPHPFEFPQHKFLCIYIYLHDMSPRLVFSFLYLYSLSPLSFIYKIGLALPLSLKKGLGELELMAHVPRVPAP